MHVNRRNALGLVGGSPIGMGDLAATFKGTFFGLYGRRLLGSRHFYLSLRPLSVSVRKVDFAPSIVMMWSWC